MRYVFVTPGPVPQTVEVTANNLHDALRRVPSSSTLVAVRPASVPF